MGVLCIDGLANQCHPPTLGLWGVGVVAAASLEMAEKDSIGRNADASGQGARLCCGIAAPVASVASAVGTEASGTGGDGFDVPVGRATAASGSVDMPCTRLSIARAFCGPGM